MKKEILKSYRKSKTDQTQSLEDPKIIVYELIQALNNNLKFAINNMDQGKFSTAKINAKKAQKITYALKSSLDHNDGGEVAKNLDYLYSHIHYAVDYLIKNEKSSEQDSADLMKSAYFVSSLCAAISTASDIAIPKLPVLLGSDASIFFPDSVSLLGLAQRCVKPRR